MNELHKHYLLKFSDLRNRHGFLELSQELLNHLEVEDRTISEYPEHLPDIK